MIIRPSAQEGTQTTIKEHPKHEDALALDLKLLSTPKSVKEALASPQ